MFQGNFDNDTHRKNVIEPPIYARLIRILPWSWYGRITLRVEILGCTEEEWRLFSACFFLFFPLSFSLPLKPNPTPTPHPPSDTLEFHPVCQKQTVQPVKRIWFPVDVFFFSSNTCSGVGYSLFFCTIILTEKSFFWLKMCLLIVNVCHPVLNEPCNIAERGGESVVLVCRHGNQLYSVTF